jgi:hypothetical protein
MVAHACHPSYGGKPKIGDSNSRLAQAKCTRPYLQNSQSKDWRRGSSSRAPALQLQSPEFKTPFHYCQKNKKRNFSVIIVQGSGSFTPKRAERF